MTLNKIISAPSFEVNWVSPVQVKVHYGSTPGQDPDIAPLKGHQFWQGVKGAAVGPGSPPPPPPSKTIFIVLNGFGELSFIMFLAYFFIHIVQRNASYPRICMLYDVLISMLEFHLALSLKSEDRAYGMLFKRFILYA